MLVLWSVLFLALINIYGQGLNDHGLWGSTVLPSAAIHEEGRLVSELRRSLPLYSPNSFERVGAHSFAWNYVPFSRFEVGGSYVSEILSEDSLPRSDFGSVSLKYQFPRSSRWFPEVAIGFQNLGYHQHPWKQLFMAGGYSLGTREVGLRIDVAGQYIPLSTFRDDTLQLGLASVTGIATHLILSEFRFFNEYTYDAEDVVQNFGLWFSPFDESDSLFRAPSMSMGGGVRNYFDSTRSQWWASIQFSFSSWSDAQRAFLGMSDERFLYWWWSPEVEFKNSKEVSLEQSYGLRQDAWVPLYERQWGWRTSWSHFSWTQPRMANTYFRWNNSYFSGVIGQGDDGEAYSYAPPQVVLGYLGPHSRGGIVRQSLQLRDWVPSYLDAGLYEGSGQVLNSYLLLTQPLHPKISSWQNYLESGLYRDENWGGALLSRLWIGSQWSAQIEGGWRSGFRFGVTLQWSPVFSHQIGPIQIGLLPLQRQSMQATQDFAIDNLESHRFHELFLPHQFYEGDMDGEGHFMHKMDAETLCQLYPANEFCLKRFDEDLDGVGDEFDNCIDIPEDLDGFEDSDGCPDEDNDQDNVPDAQDKCPMIKEDRDGSQDHDGCPEDDNDGDGIKDLDDQCPNVAEDQDYFQDEDGCPEDDNDQDGIKDLIDVCPNHPEDKDGIDDRDGCPDLKDDDEIPDNEDICPDQTEDFDGFQDFDGCADLDNDFDEIPDLNDRCPNEREVYNSLKDQDGCPD